jgi:exonuclease III
MVNNSLSLLTLNIQGLRAPNNRATLFSWLNCVQADIICLQETHSTSVAEFESWVLFETNAGNNLQQYSVISSPGSVRSAGVAVLYKPSLKLDATFHDDVGRLVIAHFSDPSCDSSPFQVVNIYGPNRRQLGEDFFTSILPQIDPSLPTFLCGDFNTVVDPHIDRRGCNPSSYWSYNWPQSLSLLTSQLDLVDAWRRRHPTDRHFTWHRPCGSQASRLDMVWTSPHLLEHVHQVDILPFFRSDHSYVFLRISLPSMPKRGPGTWKFNSSLLTNDDYIDQVRVFWQMWQQEKASFPSLAVWWDAGKKRIKDLSRTFASRKARARRVRIKSLIFNPLLTGHFGVLWDLALCAVVQLFLRSRGW